MIVALPAGIASAGMVGALDGALKDSGSLSIYPSQVSSFDDAIAAFIKSPGKEVGSLVGVAIKGNLEKAEAVVALAVTIKPKQTDGVVRSAILAGAEPGVVVAAVMTAKPNLMKDAVMAAIGVAPEKAVDIINAAIMNGNGLTTITALLRAMPDRAEMIVTTAVKLLPDVSGGVVLAAIRAGIDPGIAVMAAVSGDMEQAGIIVSAALSLSPKDEDLIIQSAIIAGADPTMVAAATAAGLAPPSPFAPAAMPSVGIGQGGVTPFGVGYWPGGSHGDPTDLTTGGGSGCSGADGCITIGKDNASPS